MGKLLKSISIYSFGNVISASISFLLLPLYTRVLSPADYGELELLYLVASILGILYGLIISSGYNRIYFEHKDIIFRKKLFSTGQLFTLFCSILFASLMFINVDWFSKTILNANIESLPILLITISTILVVMTKIPISNLRVREMPKQFVAANLIGLLFTIITTIIFVVVYRLGVLGVLYGKITGDAVKFSFLYYLTRNEFKFEFSMMQLGMMLSFSVFLIPSNLSSLILNMSNRWFLQEYQTMDDVGLFSLGAKFAAIIPMLFTEPVKLAFTPYIFNQIDKPEICKKNLAEFSRVFFIGLSIVVLIISLFTREAIMIIADKSYYGSHDVTFILSLSYLFLGLAGIVVLGIQVVRKTWIITVIWVISAILNIILNIWLIPIYGKMGAALATLLSVIFITLFYFIAVARVYPIKFKYSTFFIASLLTIGISYIGSLLEFDIFLSILSKSLLLVLYIVILFLFGIVNKEEIELTKNVINRKILKK